jgi:hypothetical protein
MLHYDIMIKIHINKLIHNIYTVLYKFEYIFIQYLIFVQDIMKNV